MDEILQAINTTLLVVCGLGVASNLLAVVFFGVNRQLHVKYYGFVFHLVLADIAAPFFTFLYKLTTTFRVPLVQAFIRTSFCAVELSIFAVAVNRLMALTITPPARYDAIVTWKRMAVACLLIWLVSGLLYVPTTFVHTPVVVRFVRPLIAIAILLFTAVLYCAVFRKIAQFRVPLASTSGSSPGEEQARTRIRQTRHLMITFAVILVTCFACWVPYCSANFSIYFSGMEYAKQSRGIKIFSQTSVVILMLNSVINPFIYWWRIPEFREGLYKIICRRQLTVDPEEPMTMQTIQDPA